jgi:ADP-ribose pyrophosphatase YjhB (NUDIX family)
MTRVLQIADELRALATTGLHFSQGEFDRARYDRLLLLAAELAALEGAGEPRHMLELFRAADQGYVTPKLDVRMALFRGDGVLLVRERVDGLWCLPGGFVDVGDSPTEAAARETLEEAGVVARVRRLAGIFDNRLHPDCPAHLFQIHKLVFVGELVDAHAAPRAGSEASDAAFHALDSLPPLSLGRTLPLHLEHARRVARDPHALPHLE